MSSPSQTNPPLFARRQQSSPDPRHYQKRPKALNRPPSDTEDCIRKTLGPPLPLRGLPGGDDTDPRELKAALERFYGVMSRLQGETLVMFEQRFNADLRSLSGQYDRASHEMDQTYRELCVFVRRTLETFEEDVKYFARCGFETMGRRVAGRLVGPYSVTKVVETVLDWWRNPWDQKRVEDVRSSVDKLRVRRARGCVDTMRKNREVVEDIKRNVAQYEGEMHWNTCLRILGMDANNVNIGLLFVATAEQGWRIEAGAEFNEFAVDLGANEKSSRCMIFPSPLCDGVRDELFPVVCIKSLNEELFGLLTGDRWFALHDAQALFGMVVYKTYVEMGERPESWGIVERRYETGMSLIDTKDCLWLSRLLDGDEVTEVTEVTELYDDISIHARRGDLPEGYSVGLSVVKFRESLQRNGILATGDANSIMSGRNISCLYSITKTKEGFSKALGETILGMIRTRTIIQCDDERAKFEECNGWWNIKVTGGTGGTGKRISKELEKVLQRVVELVRRRGIYCVVEGANIQDGDARIYNDLHGRIGLRFHDLWNLKNVKSG